MKCTYDKCTEEEVCDNFLDEWGPKQIDMNIWGWLWLTESHLNRVPCGYLIGRNKHKCSDKDMLSFLFVCLCFLYTISS